MYYTRSHFIISSILKNHGDEGGNLLIVGHVSRTTSFFSLSVFRSVSRFRLGADDRSVHETTDGRATSNQRIEISRSPRAVLSDALRGQTNRWKLESDQTTDLADQARRCRAVRLAIFSLKRSFVTGIKISETKKLFFQFSFSCQMKSSAISFARKRR